jgi:ATP-dependent RNA helicase DOB1
MLTIIAPHHFRDTGGSARQQNTPQPWLERRSYWYPHSRIQRISVQNSFRLGFQSNGQLEQILMRKPSHLIEPSNSRGKRKHSGVGSYKPSAHRQPRKGNSRGERSDGARKRIHHTLVINRRDTNLPLEVQRPSIEVSAAELRQKHPLLSGSRPRTLTLAAPAGGENSGEEESLDRSSVGVLGGPKDDSGEDRCTCIHTVSIPATHTGYDPGKISCWPPSRRAPAKEYPFTLDSFQIEACKCLEAGESVLVAAHTSAGKTVVAEYAIALSLREHRRVIYTSPIKALSNQKYREFQSEFGDVGLITGDVTMNPNASCLIMTTEILRSMLYRGSDVVREAAWVIFDEAHYMRDRERGVVWEESIILLPDTVRFVFLSATIPNAEEFAEWIVALHNSPCHTVYTDKRPVPLRHYALWSQEDGVILLKDEHGKFHGKNFAQVRPKDRNFGFRGPNRGRTLSNADFRKVVRLAIERNFEPMIVFSFSRKDCESLARYISVMDLNTEEEKALVEDVYRNAMATLSEQDQKLEQIGSMLEMLKRGIGVHHSGLLPIVKEIVEILFQEGLVKVLLATETFALGLNMPARMVFFTALKKFDGRNVRYITSGEYIQMSGRAGRRGLDERGIVILKLEDDTNEECMRRILSGRPDVLTSAFRLGYNMLLNLQRSEEAKPEQIMIRSFAQFQAMKRAESAVTQLESIETELKQIQLSNDEQQVELFASLSQRLDEIDRKISRFYRSDHVDLFLKHGRLLKLRGDQHWSVFVDCRCCGSSKKSSVFSIYRRKEDGSWHTESFRRHLIHFISAVCIEMPKLLDSEMSRRVVFENVESAERHYARVAGGLPLLDPVHDFGIHEKWLLTLMHERRNLLHELRKITSNNPDVFDDAKLFELRLKLCQRAAKIQRDLRMGQRLIYAEELGSMNRVLHVLGYLDENQQLSSKGRVCCEISTANELVLTECIFEGIFRDLPETVIPAILSGFVLDEKSKEDADIKLDDAELRDHFRKVELGIHNVVGRIERAQSEAGLSFDYTCNEPNWDPNIMSSIYAWCKGRPFSEVMKVAQTFEGSLIRCMRRVDEVLQQLRTAVDSIGDAFLSAKFTQSSALLHRDIVFAASLYL